MIKQDNENKSIIFNWNKDELDLGVQECYASETVQICLKYMQDKNAKILEAGCGSGRIVKFLHQIGFKNVAGVELNETAVKNANEKWPELDISYENILHLSEKYLNNDIVFSYGVIEHFEKGIEAPLKATYDSLKDGGLAFISVPSNNIMRSFLALFDKERKKDSKKYKYMVYKQNNEFYEYRLTKKEFENLCTSVGFKIIKSIPILVDGGIFHIFNLNNNKLKFCIIKHIPWLPMKLGFIGKILYYTLGKIPFFFNHMHLCILQK